MKTVAEKRQRKEGTQIPVKRNRKKSEDLKTDGPFKRKGRDQKSRGKITRITEKTKLEYLALTRKS